MSKFDDKIFIGNIIRIYRKKNKITQEELAEKVDLSVQHVSKIESGKYVPSLKSFFEIVHVLNIDLGIFDIETVNINSGIKKDLIEKVLIANDKELVLYNNIFSAIQNTNFD